LSSATSSYVRLVGLTLAITPSGALSPGPLSASAVAVGALVGPLGGFVVAFGHMVVELPYVLLLYRLSSQFRVYLERFKVVLNAVVVAFLLFFSYMLLRDAISIALGGAPPALGSTVAGGGLLGAFLTGVTLTGFNVYFLLWWLTVGYPLVEESAKLGLRGFTIMYSSHVWMDYAWLTLLASGGLAIKLAGSTAYAALLAALALVLVFFATRIALDTISYRQ